MPGKIEAQPDPRGDGERLLSGTLGWARIGIGAAVWLAPRASMRVLGFSPDDPQIVSLAHLAGTRDLALGALAVGTNHDPQAAATVLRLNAAVDALDALAFSIPLARRRGIDRAALLGVSTATAASMLGLWLAGRADNAHKSQSI